MLVIISAGPVNKTCSSTRIQAEAEAIDTASPSTSHALLLALYV
jgi:hypothetical protein